jgi:hypothetical protein
MIHFRSILVLYLILGTSLTLLAADQPVKKPEASVPDPPKVSAAPTTPLPRSARPIRPRSAPPARSEHPKPHVEAISHQPVVVWDRNWVNPVTVEWEDAPTRKPPIVEKNEPSASVAEELVAIKKNLEELTQMVRALAAQQQARE